MLSRAGMAFVCRLRVTVFAYPGRLRQTPTWKEEPPDFRTPTLGADGRPTLYCRVARIKAATLGRRGCLPGPARGPLRSGFEPGD